MNLLAKSLAICSRPHDTQTFHVITETRKRALKTFKMAARRKASVSSENRSSKTRELQKALSIS
jgi:hypothetical protein